MFASEPQNIQESTASIASEEEEQAGIDSHNIDSSPTPSIPEAPTSGQPENTNVNTIGLQQS